MWMKMALAFLCVLAWCYGSPQQEWTAWQALGTGEGFFLKKKSSVSRAGKCGYMKRIITSNDTNNHTLYAYFGWWNQSTNSYVRLRHHMSTHDGPNGKDTILKTRWGDNQGNNYDIKYVDKPTSCIIVQRFNGTEQPDGACFMWVQEHYAKKDEQLTTCNNKYKELKCADVESPYDNCQPLTLVQPIEGDQAAFEPTHS